MEKSSGNGWGWGEKGIRSWLQMQTAVGMGGARKCAGRCVEEECERFVGKRLDKGRADWPDIPIRAEISDPINSVLPSPPPPASPPFSPFCFFLLLLPLFRSLPSTYRFFSRSPIVEAQPFFLFFPLFYSTSPSISAIGEVLRSPLRLSLTARAEEISF